MLEIKLVDVSKSYKDKVILRGINLEIARGEFVMLRGQSGAGKSTLLNIIGGIEQPTTGQILIEGKDVGKFKKQERVDFYRHQVGFIFQGFYLQSQLSLMENIALPGVFAEMSRPECEARVRELAEILHIEQVLSQKPAEVSGGQAERACVARALFMNPKLVLADEPTNNLDPENAKNVINILYAVWKQLGTTVIVASHDKIVEDYATQIITMRDGEIQPAGEMQTDKTSETEIDFTGVTNATE